MKKVLLASAMIMMSMFSFAQLGLGVKGAVTMSNITTNVSDYKEAAKTGYQLGAFVRVGDKWHLQPEVYFSLKNGQFNFDITEIDPGNLNTVTKSVNYTTSLNTIDIPVLLGYTLIDPPLMNIRLQAGPVASIVTNKSFKIEVDGVEQTVDDNEGDIFKDLNWGLQVGAGVDFLMFTVDLRYELGLSNIYDKPEGATEDQTYKNNVFFLSVGWKIL
ncbi:MAG: PorT family protein [Chlorobi bacterium]|nr:PorT family protein [Chlorobiota bacterium]